MAMVLHIQLASSTPYFNKIQNVKLPEKRINPFCCSWKSLILFFAFFCGSASPTLTIQHSTELPYRLL